MEECAAFFYSQDGATQSDELPTAELAALVAAGTITATTLIFSEVASFEFDGWTPWAECCASFGFAASPPSQLCSLLTYSTDGQSQSAEISATKALELAESGTINADTLIYSEQPEFGFDTWTRWADCCQCFGGAPPAVAAACSSLYYAAEPDKLLSLEEAMRLVAAGTIGPNTLIFSEQPAFSFDDWTPWAGCSFCFGVGDRDAVLAVAANEDVRENRSCSTLYYSIDGVNSSEELSIAAAWDLIDAGAIMDDTLIFSKQAAFDFSNWTKWSECKHCFPPPSEPHVAPRAVVCYGWLEKKGGDTHIDERNVLKKERHYLKGGRRNWKRRWFVLHSDGELSYYSNAPKAPTGGSEPTQASDVVPHYIHWKGRVQLLAHSSGDDGARADGMGPTLHVRDDSSETFLLGLPKEQVTAAMGGGGEDSSRNAMMLRAADEAERQVWISAVSDTFGAPIVPLLYDCEERGVAERTMRQLRTALDVAGGGLRADAARLPADQAIALFEFVAEHPGDLGFQKGQKLQLEHCQGDWWTGRLILGGDSGGGDDADSTEAAAAGTFPATFVCRGKSIPAKPPPKAAAVPAVPVVEAPAPAPASVDAQASTGTVEEGVPPAVVQTDAVLAARFAKFDSNQDGVLGTDEVAGLMHAMGFEADRDYINALLKKFDGNGDGVLDVHEFAPLFTFLRNAN